MSIEKFADHYYKLCYALKEDLRKVLQKIDNGPYHSLAPEDLDEHELKAAKKLHMLDLIRLMPEGHRFTGGRYVVTTGGSYKLDTFKHSKLHS